MSNTTYLLSNAWTELPKIASESIDLGITDPPYMSMGSKSTSDRASEAQKIVGVFKPEDFLIFTRELFRVLKQNRHAYIFAQEKIYCPMKTALEQAGFSVKNTLIWAKKTFTKGNFYLDYPLQTEMIFYVIKDSGDPRPLGMGVHSNLLAQFMPVPSERMIHPTQKPVPLLEFLILRSSKEGETVLDPFAGVGTTLQAAMNLNRNAIGFEIVEEFFKKGQWLLTKE
jgi:site-specific DNA-methyltransferase (adenine-specific)